MRMVKCCTCTFCCSRVLIHVAFSSVIFSVPEIVPQETTLHLGQNITFSCLAGDSSSISDYTWYVNGTVYSKSPSELQWTDNHEKLHVNTDALKFPLCAAELMCEAKHVLHVPGEDWSTYLVESQPLHLKINGMLNIVMKVQREVYCMIIEH